MTETDVKKWYVVRAVSGQENKIKTYIESEISRHGLSDYVEDVLVPTEKVIQISRDGTYNFDNCQQLPCIGKHLQRPNL